jgi:hypothetical protein
MPIDTTDSLRAHLRTAMRIELATVPMYLYALYSIDDPATDAARLIRSIVAEEMLHLALVANLLLAIGGEPEFLGADLLPTYPSTLPNHEPPLTLNLAPATPDQIVSTFLVLEQPDPEGSSGTDDVYDSLGEFYAAIEEAVGRLPDLFGDPQVERQLSDPRFYAAVAFNNEDSGDLMQIDGVTSARAAIDVIIHQGEGLSDGRWADESHQELTHYAKLRQIADGISPVGRLRLLPVNPRVGSYPPGVRSVADLFNAVYAAAFVILDDLYQPVPKKGRLVSRLYAVMTSLLGPIGRYLATLPLDATTFAGPTFEPYDLGPDPASTLADLAASVAADHPALAEVVAPLVERRLLPE